MKHLTAYYKRGLSGKAKARMLHVRLTAAEYAVLLEAAKAEGLCLSAWARKKLGVG